MSTQALTELKDLEITLRSLAAGVPANRSEASQSLAKEASRYLVNTEYLIIQKLSPDAVTPTKNNTTDAGYDLYAASNATVPAWGKAIVGTQLCVNVPVGTYGRVASRSGLSVNYDLEVGAGVIDEGYTGELKVVLRNFSDTDYNIQQGDKIAQLIIEQCKHCVIKDVKNINDMLGRSKRGANGFGSSGK